jgi:arylsulfatase A-like enzyme
LLDLPPTLLDICGLSPPDEYRFHGESLLPLISGESEKPPDWRQEAVASYNGQQFGLYTQRMIRTREWKYVWNHTDVDELYDMNEDPHELRNLASHPSNREVLKELRSRLFDILLRDGDGMVKNEWMRRQLLEGRKK